MEVDTLCSQSDSRGFLAFCSLRRSSFLLSFPSFFLSDFFLQLVMAHIDKMAKNVALIQHFIYLFSVKFQLLLFPSCLLLFSFM